MSDLSPPGGAQEGLASYTAAIVRSARSQLGASGESLPRYASRMGISYSSLWRLLNGRDVRARTLEKMHKRIVLEGPALRPQADIGFLGTTTYLRARGFSTAPYLEAADLGPVTILQGGPGSGRTTVLLMLALATDPLGPWYRVASRAAGGELVAEAADTVALGRAGQLRASYGRQPGPDPVRVEVQARLGSGPRAARFGSMQLPAAGTPSLARYVGHDPEPGDPRSALGRLALRKAGFHKAGAPMGRSARQVSAFAAALELASCHPGLVLCEDGIPPEAQPPLAELALAAAASGAQVVWVSGPEDLGTLVQVRRDGEGAVFARSARS